MFNEPEEKVIIFQEDCHTFDNVVRELWHFLENKPDMKLKAFSKKVQQILARPDVQDAPQARDVLRVLSYAPNPVAKFRELVEVVLRDTENPNYVDMDID